MGGDFNCVENVKSDANTHKDKRSNNVKYLQNLCHYGGIADPFRACYPTKIALTHVTSSQPSHIPVSARLGWFYISYSLLLSVKDISISLCIFSDHDYVILSCKMFAFLTPNTVKLDSKNVSIFLLKNLNMNVILRKMNWKNKYFITVSYKMIVSIPIFSSNILLIKRWNVMKYYIMNSKEPLSVPEFKT